MDVWFAKGVFLAASVALVAIRAPHGHRSGKVKVAKSEKGPLESVLLTLAWTSFFVPLVWVCSSAFDFAEYPLRPIPWALGTVLLALGLWLFHRSHADLGTNWSITLEIREGHRLVTEGVYRRIRHPMYASLFLQAIGQALVVPNAVAGPAYLVAFVVLYAFRVAREERMMRERFGPEYDAYAARTKRLVPGIW